MTTTIKLYTRKNSGSSAWSREPQIFNASNPLKCRETIAEIARRLRREKTRGVVIYNKPDTLTVWQVGKNFKIHNLNPSIFSGCLIEFIA